MENETLLCIDYVQNKILGDAGSLCQQQPNSELTLEVLYRIIEPFDLEGILKII